MSFVSHVNNTCVAPPAIKNSQVPAKKSPTALAQQLPGVITKISNAQPAEPATYTVPTLNKDSINNVAGAALRSTVGGAVGAAIGGTWTRFLTMSQSSLPGIAMGGAIGASLVEDNVFEALSIDPQVGAAVTGVIGLGLLGLIASRGQNVIPNNAPVGPLKG